MLFVTFLWADDTPLSIRACTYGGASLKRFASIARSLNYWLDYVAYLKPVCHIGRYTPESIQGRPLYLHVVERLPEDVRRQLTRGGFVNDFTDTLTAYGPTEADAATRLPGHIYLPRKIYDALPATYFFLGALFVLGSAYIGIGHGVGYLAVGVICILRGAMVVGRRHKERT